MPFLPQTKKERTRLYYVILLLIVVGIELFFAFQYGIKRDSDLRAFTWDTDTLWRLKRDYEGEAFSRKIETNAQGFRGTEETPKSEEFDLRVITLGDSRTYGFDVENDETYSAVLERELRENKIDSQVLNAGTHGFSAVQCRAKLESLLDYKPDIVVFAPGYNDRRYLITRPPDDDDNFAGTARLLQAKSIVELSHTMFGLLYVMGKQKLQQIINNPPPLNEVKVRVSEKRFALELDRVAKICRENNIQLIYLAMRSDPGTYGFIDHTMRLHEEGKTEEAIQRIEEAGHEIPNYSHTISHYYLGMMYESIGDSDKAAEAYADHRVNGSLFGESILRLERYYFDRMRAAAHKHHVPLVDSKMAIVGSVPEKEVEDHLFNKYFVDECHYNPDGHNRIGAAIAQTVLSMQ